jgi:hypothetical protein
LICRSRHYSGIQEHHFTTTLEQQKKRNNKNRGNRGRAPRQFKATTGARAAESAEQIQNNKLDGTATDLVGERFMA